MSPNYVAMCTTAEAAASTCPPLTLSFQPTLGKPSVTLDSDKATWSIAYLIVSPFVCLSVHRVVGHCRSCRELDNQARAREDYTLYRAMLRTIRKSEERYKDESHVIFLMQVSI